MARPPGAQCGPAPLATRRGFSPGRMTAIDVNGSHSAASPLVQPLAQALEGDLAADRPVGVVRDVSKASSVPSAFTV